MSELDDDGLALFHRQIDLIAEETRRLYQLDPDPKWPDEIVCSAWRCENSIQAKIHPHLGWWCPQHARYPLTRTEIEFGNGKLALLIKEAYRQ